MRISHIFTCGLPSSTVFFHFTLKWHDFQKKTVTEQKMCFDFLYIFVGNIPRRIEREMIKIVY